MIEGLKFDVQSKEIKQHLAVKAQHHQERAKFYDEKASALQSGGAESMQYTNGDPVKALRDKQSQHENRRTFFDFLAAHLVDGETYRLSEDNLLTLEFISKGYHW